MDSNNVAKSKPGQYLTFVLHSRHFGVPIGVVKEINRVGDITPVPHNPEYVAGVMNLRGKVIPVIDLRKKFSVPVSAYTRETCIIVIESEQGPVGAIVDAVSDVAVFNEDQIELPPMLAQESERSYVVGVGKLENRIIMMVDVVSALSEDGSEVIEQTREAA